MDGAWPGRRSQLERRRRESGGIRIREGRKGELERIESVEIRVGSRRKEIERGVDNRGGERFFSISIDYRTIGSPPVPRNK